jgi:hypothetical protein
MLGETPSSDEATSNLDRIDISIPLRAQFASTLRTLVASIGADIGFSVDELDDLRLALSEIFSVLADVSSSDSRALVSLTSTTSTPPELVISIRRSDTDTTFEFDELAASILKSVTNTYEIGPGGVTFSKRGTELGSGPHGS